MKTQGKSEVKPEEQIRKIKKYNMFSQSETTLLTGFTRGQLVKWDKSKIVQPYRHPCVLYDWNQIIVLKILYYWREKASYQKIVRVLSEENVDKFFEHVQKSSLAFFNDQKLVFVNDSFHEDQVLFAKILKGLKTSDIESVDFTEVIPGLVLLNVASIIYNLKIEGELLKIEDFAKKVG